MEKLLKCWQVCSKTGKFHKILLIQQLKAEHGTYKTIEFLCVVHVFTVAINMLFVGSAERCFIHVTSGHTCRGQRPGTGALSVSFYFDDITGAKEVVDLAKRPAFPAHRSSLPLPPKFYTSNSTLNFHTSNPTYF